ncbi:MAG: macro domain-containing protein [Nitrososphaeraceae archaeon]
MSAEILDQIKLTNGKTTNLVKGDITERSVDVIVNAANSYLTHGGGVAAAIVRKGGQVIQQESDKLGFVQFGSAVITTAGKLSCKSVIHAVGPKMGEGDEDNKLRKAVQSSLTLASEKGFKSISIPAISSGIFGFPKDKCAKILVNESIGFLKNRNTTSIEAVEFCLIDNETLHCFKIEFDNIKEYSDD